MFPTFGFLAQQILGIVGLQIEIERIFCLVEILIKLRGCCLQTKNVKRLVFVIKKLA
jgi:hypothetical protein